MSKELTKGDAFAIAGYDLVAAAQCAEGGGAADTEEFIVLNNNSSHYLVAGRERRGTTATLLASFGYGRYDYYTAAYALALHEMLELALRH